MAKAFATYAGFPIQSAKAALDMFRRANIDPSAFRMKANSYRCPIGKEPGIGYVLMRRQHVQAIATNAGHTLQFGVGSDYVTFPTIFLKRAYRISPGWPQDANALYLVELTDRRWLAQMTCIDKQYNIRSACGEGLTCPDEESTDEDYIESTTNNGTPYTWQEVAADIWETVGVGLLGASSFAWPGYGGTLSLGSTPENLNYTCMSAWDALNDFAHRIGAEVRYDPVADAFNVVQMGAGLDALDPRSLFFNQGGAYPPVSDLTPNGTAGVLSVGLLEDAETIIGAFNYPAAVRVCFPANHVDCGDNCRETPSHSVTVEASSITIDGRYVLPLRQAASGTCVVVHDAMHATFEGDDEPTNLTDLEDRAIEVANDYYRSLVDDVDGRLVFSGMRYIPPGPFVSESLWRDYGDGLKTEIKRYRPKLERMEFPVDCTGGDGKWHKFRNVSEEEIPAYAVVEISGSSEIAGQGIVLNAGKPSHYGGQNYHFVNGPTAVPADEYGYCTNAETPTLVLLDPSGFVSAANRSFGPLDDQWGVVFGVPGFRALGKPCSGNTVLAVREPARTIRAKLEARLGQGGSVEASPYYWDGTEWVEFDDSESSSGGSPHRVTVREHMGLFDGIEAGTVCTCSWEASLKGFIVVSTGCEPEEESSSSTEAE